MQLAAILIEALGIIIFIAAMSITIYSSVIGAPYVWTPSRAVREIFKIAGLKKGDKVYDLGAGNGQNLIIADKEFDARALGFELSPILYLAAKINIFIKGAKKSQISWRNFYNQNLADADLIFCFLTVHAMVKLKPKFEAELRPGTKVISYAFSIHGWTPKQMLKGYPGNVYLYEK
jgi:SAM-dependent methyltransferase